VYLGRTHIAIALGVAAVAVGYRVRFVQVVNLVQELLKANAEYRQCRALFLDCGLTAIHTVGHSPPPFEVFHESAGTTHSKRLPPMQRGKV